MRNQWFKQFSVATVGFVGLMLVMLIGQIEHQENMFKGGNIDTQVTTQKIDLKVAYK
jgi:hypothetical protein